MNSPLQFGNSQYKPPLALEVSSAHPAFTLLPRYIPLSRSSWDSLDMARFCFDSAAAFQRHIYKRIKRPKKRSIGKINTPQRVGNVKALKGRSSVNTRRAIKLFNSLVDAAAVHPGQIWIHRSYLYNTTHQKVNSK